MKVNLDKLAESLVHKIRHYLIATMGRIAEEASTEEFYRAFSYAFREEIMINWAATAKTFVEKDVRMLYYLSMEYLPGRIFGNNISSLHAQEFVQRVARKMNRNLNQVLCYEPDPGLGNGGLGRLASCFLDSLATQQYPAQGYGLRYQYGTFAQELWDGVQVERPDCWLLNANPWEFRRDQRAMNVKFCGRTEVVKNSYKEDVLELHDYEEVRALSYDIPIVGYNAGHDYSVISLRLWSTKESPKNFGMQRFNAGQLGPAAENTTLTDVLYPNDNHDIGKRIRLKQEFLLVSASLQDIIRHYLATHDDFSLFADKVRIQINDTHPALAIAELMRLFTREHDLPWDKALEITQQSVNYTNHTIMREALEQWNQNRMRHLLPRQYDVIDKLNMEFCRSIRKKFPDEEDRVRRMSIIEDGQVRMAHLAIYGSTKVNGVARLHSDIIKKSIFKDFLDMWPEKFTNVTNGVTQRRWLLHCNPSLANFISERIGKEWITDFSQISKLAAFAQDKQSQQEFSKIKEENKQRLIDHLKTTGKIRDYHGKPIEDGPVLSLDALFDVQVKRIHEYKRQLLNVLHAIMIYQELLDDPESRKIKRTIFIGGKAAAGYEIAKKIIRLIHCMARRINNDKRIKDKLKIVFLENYNVSSAEVIIPAAELSQQISMAGMEASGTGNMKLSINGALTIGTEDGANIEMREGTTDKWWPFSFGSLAEEIEEKQRTQSYDPWNILSEHPKIARAVEALRDQTFSKYDAEHHAFLEIYASLVDGVCGSSADKYFLLQDLPSYYDTQKEVEDLYCDTSKWAEYAIQNVAGMGSFSSDVSIDTYAKNIWGLKRCPPDPSVLEKVREDYTQYDKCYILALET
jgi:glycogen phosphorylase